MDIPNFIPLNPIEKVLIKAKKSDVLLLEVIEVLLASKLFMPNLYAVDEKGDGFMPLLFDRDGTPMAAIFTDKSRADIHQKK